MNSKYKKILSRLVDAELDRARKKNMYKSGVADNHETEELLEILQVLNIEDNTPH